MTLGRAMADDVRPFWWMKRPVELDRQRWRCQLLVYGTNTTDAFPEHQLGRIKPAINGTKPD